MDIDLNLLEHRNQPYHQGFDHHSMEIFPEDLFESIQTPQVFFDNELFQHIHPSPQYHLEQVEITQQKITPSQYDEKLECSICLVPFELDVEYAGLKCGHIFHQECLEPWTHGHQTCPYCLTII
jgi:hypothetical protein